MTLNMRLAFITAWIVLALTARMDLQVEIAETRSGIVSSNVACGLSRLKRSVVEAETDDHRNKARTHAIGDCSRAQRT